MNNNLTQAIWNPETGITDLEGDPQTLSASEIPGIKAVWADKKQRLKGSPQLEEFTEKLNREWAIETGLIENLYDIERGVTQTLIEYGFQAELLPHGSINKPTGYVIQLLRDQQDALEGLFDFVKSDRPLSKAYIKELHTALLRSQEATDGVDAYGDDTEIPLIKGDWKTQANDPERNGITYTYCPPEHVDAEMDRLVAMHEDHVAKNIPCEVQAAWLHHRFTQIHPFQDGNGRVAGAIASLILVRDDLFPLVVTRDERKVYLDALEEADQGDLKPLVDLVATLQSTQSHKASGLSDVIRDEEEVPQAEEDVLAALNELHEATEKIAADNLQELKGVFKHAGILASDIEERLEEISPRIETALRKVVDSAEAFVIRSNEENGYYFRGQIIENARDHIGYYADTREYGAWVALNLRWSRRCQLVFTIHGIGKPFNGSLICAPFLEFKDMEEGETRTTLVPVTEDGFVFFYNENQDNLLSRFAVWRDKIITAALKELTQNNL